MNKDFNNMSEEEQLECIKLYPYSIQRINEPSYRCQLTAINASPYAIGYIKSPSEEIQRLVLNEIYAIEYIDQPIINLFIKNKNQILSNLLYEMKIGNGKLITGLVKYLVKHQIDWPELEIIEDSLKADGYLNI